MAVPKVKIRPQVTVTRHIHLVYAAHLEALERMGIDLERVITIATNAVHNVGTVIPPEKPESNHEHWVAGHCAAGVQLVAGAEYCRETWESGWGINRSPMDLYPEAQQRVRTRVTEYLQTINRS